MKKLQKVTALVLAFTYLMSLASFAAYDPKKVKEILDAELKEELSYIDDVYKYDLDLLSGKKAEEEEVEEIIEELKYEKAVNVADALGLIVRRSDGFFAEDEPLAVDVFCTIAEKLTGSGAEYAGETAVTHYHALRMVMDALGCEYITEEAALIQNASRKDVLLGLTYNRDKFITRGEAALMIYNALCAEVVEMKDLSSDSISYKTTEGYTLLNKAFGMQETVGLVTGANGIDIYANRTVPGETVEINRVSYRLDKNADVSSLLGQRVYALVDTDNLNKVVFLGIEKDMESVTIPFDSVTELSSHIGWEIGESKGKAPVSQIKYVTVNGNTSVGSSALSQINSGEGTIILGSTDGSRYDIAVINKYETVVINRLAELDERIYFNDNLTVGGRTFIDISDAEKISVTRDGAKIAPTDIKAGDVASIYVATNGAAKIEISTKTVKGKIDALIDGRVVIKDKEYEISDAYGKAKANGAMLPLLSVGTEGVFMLNSLGQIAYVKNNESAFNYGVVRGVMSMRGGLEKKVGLKIFNYESEWLELTFKDGAKIDGVPMSLARIDTQLQTIESNISGKILTFKKADGTEVTETCSFLGSIVRYSANRDNQITALDTLDPMANDFDDPEALHADKLRLWDGKLAWTKGKTLMGSPYGLDTDSLVFFVPEVSKIDEEENYSVLEQKNIPGEGEAKFIIYNPTEFMRSKLVVYKGSTITGNYPDSTKQFLVETVARGIDKYENEVIIIKGYDAAPGGVNPIWKPASYTLTRDLYRKITDEGLSVGHAWKGSTVRTVVDDDGKKVTIEADPECKESIRDIQPGDLLWREFDSNGDIAAVELEMYAGAVGKKWPSKYMYAQENQNDKLWGIVMAVNPAEGRMLVNCHPDATSEDPDTYQELYAPTVKIVAIFDGATGEVTPATLGDATKGDKVHLVGGWGSDNAVIYRNCETIERFGN